MGSAESRSSLANSASQAVGQNAYAACIGHLVSKGFQVVPPPGASTTATGGSEGDYFGGDEKREPMGDIRSYEYSAAAKTKEQIIRRLAEGLKSIGINVKADSIEEIGLELKKKLDLDDPSKMKSSATDDNIKKICEKIAKVFNDTFTPGAKYPLIDTKLPAEQICQQVVELINSFAVGISTELMAVQNSLKNVLNNMQICMHLMNESYKKMADEAERSSDDKVREKFEKFNVVYQLAKAEYERQTTMLNGMAKVTLAPAIDELNLALRSTGEKLEFIKRLELKPGVSGLSSIVGKMMSATGNAAAAAASVHKALKEVGMTAQKYLEEPSLSKLREDLNSLQLQYGNSKDFADFIKASAVLVKAFQYTKDDSFSSALTHPDNVSGAGEHHGGDDDEDEDNSKRTKYQKKLESTVLGRDLILRDFVQKIAHAYNGLLEAVEVVGPKFGKSIPLSSDTDTMLDIFEWLRSVQIQRSELALIGFDNRPESKNKKEAFLSHMRLLVSVCNNSELSGIKDAAEEIIKIVDVFADAVTKKYGGAVDESIEAMSRILQNSVATSSVQLTKAIDSFIYYYFVAKIRQNLKLTSSDITEYGKNYIGILGDAVGDRIQTYTKELDDLKKVNQYNNSTPNDTTTAAFKSKYEKYLANVKLVKDNFYKALQAIDIMLMEFTKAATKDPEAIRDLHKVIDDTQIIANWFDQRTCSSLTQTFDQMRAQKVSDGNWSNISSATADETIGTKLGEWSTNKHYYQTISEATKTNAGIDYGLGHPYGSVPIDGDRGARYNTVRNSLNSTIDNFQALKNIINLFFRIGDKWGNETVKEKTFMSAPQIFRALTDYFKASSFIMPVVNVDKAASADAAVNTWRAADDAHLTTASMPSGTYFLSTVKSNFPTYRLGDYQALNAAPAGALPVAGAPAGTARNMFEVEDKYFAMTLKAISAKILVSVGMFDMFERTTMPYKNIIPLRTILGGADGYPEVITEATELYFRLPRLLETYWSLLFKDLLTIKVNQFNIGLIPDIDGVFTGLIQQVFMYTAKSSIESGQYSDTEMTSIIEHINKIYNHFKDASEGPITATINGLVREVNRRYGVIKYEDIQAYKKIYQLNRDSYGSTTQYYNVNNFNILPDEDEYSAVNSVVAPSDQWSVPVSGATPKLNRTLPVDRLKFDADLTNDSSYGIVRKFRDNLAKYLDITPDKLKQYKGYNIFLKHMKSELSKLSDTKARYEFAVRLISSADMVNNDVHIVYAFHETVVTSLTLASSLFAMFEKIKDDSKYMNPDTYEKTFIKNVVAHATAVDRVNGLPTALNVDTKSSVYVAKYTLFYDEIIRAYLDGNVGTQVILNQGLLHNTAIDANAVFIGELKDGKYTFKEAINASSADPALVEFLKAMCAAFNMCFNYQLLMRDLIENLFSIQTEGFGTVTFSQASDAECRVSLNGVKDSIEKLLIMAKNYIDHFRPMLSKDIIETYEGTVDTPDAGTYYYLQREFTNKYLQTGLQAFDKASTVETVDQVAHQLTKLWNRLITVPTKGNFTSIAQLMNNSAVGGIIGNYGSATVQNNAALTLIFANEYSDPGTKVSYGLLLSEFLFYSLTGSLNERIGGDPTNAAGLANISKIYGSIGQYMKSSSSADGLSINPANRIINFYTNTEGGVLIQYFTLLNKFINTFTDPANGGKIYAPLINQLTSNSVSGSIVSELSRAFPDFVITPNINNFATYTMPQETAILPYSLAVILQRLSRDVNDRTQISVHLISTLTDVPMFMKETMKVNLPLFINQFIVLADKLKFINSIIDNTTINTSTIGVTDTNGSFRFFVGLVGALNTDNITLAVGGVARRGLNTLTNGLRDKIHSFGLSKENANEVFKGLINNLTEAIFNNIAACREVLRELGDKPTYQIGDSFVSTYEATYNKKPIIPLSLNSISIINSDQDPANIALATGLRFDITKTHPMGSANNKLLYALRYTLLPTDEKFEVSELYGSDIVKSVVSNYDQFAELSVKLYRMFTKIHILKPTIIASTAQVRRPVVLQPLLTYSTTAAALNTAALINGGTLNAAHDIQEPEKLPYIGNVGSLQLYDSGSKKIIFELQHYNNSNFATKAITLITNGNQESELSQITNWVIDGTTSAISRPKRDEERIQNILTLNINIINVHALLNNIPMINTFNYSMTFEELVKTMFAMPQQSVSRDQFIKMIQDPYSENSQLDDNVRIFRGDTTLGLTRPKFLSEMYNSVLLRDLYNNAYEYDEAGPASKQLKTSGLSGIAKLVAQQILGPAAITGLPLDISDPDFPGSLCKDYRADMALGPDWITDAKAGKHIFVLTDAAGGRRATLPVAGDASTANLYNNIFKIIDQFSQIELDLSGTPYPISGLYKIYAIGVIVNLMHTRFTRLLASSNGLDNANANAALTSAAGLNGFKSATDVFGLVANGLIPYDSDMIANGTPTPSNQITMVLKHNSLLNILFEGITDNHYKCIALFCYLKHLTDNTNKANIITTQLAAAGVQNNLSAYLKLPSTTITTYANYLEAFVPINIGNNPTDRRQTFFNGPFGFPDALVGLLQNWVILKQLPIYSMKIVNFNVPAGPNDNLDLSQNIVRISLGDEKLSILNLVWTLTGAFHTLSNFIQLFRSYVTGRGRTSSYNESRSLSYIDEHGAVQTLTVDGAWAGHFQELGQARYDTKLVRNLIFITNLQRVITKALRDELVSSRGLIISSHDAVAINTTEYDIDKFAPNQTITSKRLDGSEPF